MQIHITDAAVDYLIEELELQSGDIVRFYPKYGGNSPFQSGFTVGMSIGKALHPAVQIELKGIVFQIGENDLWFLDKGDFYVGMKNGEVHFSNEPVE